MKKEVLCLLFLTISSCTSREIIIEKIPFLHENNNAQPSLVSMDGSLSLSWISSDEKKKAALNFRDRKSVV